ncbi:hypothetical protein PTKIN_Ptkin18bG0055100 [Pterospermum kingtungense]
MALSKLEPPSPPPEDPPSPSHYYTALPSQPHDQDCVVLPYYRSGLQRWRSRRVLCTASLLLLAALVYIFWPSDPEVKIVRMHINRMQIHTIPIIALDISLLVTLKVRNSGVYSMDFTSLDVAVGYRGKMLGHVTSEHGHVRALGSSYVEAMLDLNGIEVLSDVVYILEDLAKGTVPFDTVTAVAGSLGLFFFKFPLKAKVSCEIVVNRTSQTIIRQNCYPQALQSCLTEQDLRPQVLAFFFHYMEVSKWCSSDIQELRWSQGYVKSQYDRMLSMNVLVTTRSKLPLWRLLWRKLMREKKKIFDCSSSTRVCVSYDPYTYAQNFDQGLMSANPDDLSRSFSARFAVPSRVFEKSGLVG